MGKLDGKEVVENHRTMLKNLVAFKSRGLRSTPNYQDEHAMMQQQQMAAMGGIGGMDMAMAGGNPYGGSPTSQEGWGEAGEGVIDFHGGEFR